VTQPHKHNHYSVLRPVTALHIDPERAEKPLITQLLAGCILDIKGPAQDLSGMVAVQSEGKSYAVFPQDLEERTSSAIHGK
jgi:hypothetical protein